MMFLDLVRNDMCHADSMTLGPGPSLHCNVCGKHWNVNEYMNRPNADFFHSSQLAQAYAQWTGDQTVLMSFPLSHIDGIIDTIVVGQSLDRVQKSISLLRALNAPFTTEPHVQRTSEMDTFLADFLNILYENPKVESTSEWVALQHLIRSMHGIVTVKDAIKPFDMYFTNLVPYVQRCLPEWHPIRAEPPHPNLARELHTQLILSFHIRSQFGRYAIPFDVIHVIVCCYACSCNVDVVGNFAIDFLVRICRGHFFWKRFPDCDFVHTMQHLVETTINYKTNAHYYKNVIKWFKKGETIDQYSQMWYPLHEVQAFLKRHYVVPTTTPDVLDMGFAQTFPSVLFKECPDQLGFTMGNNHLLLSMNRRTGQLPRGAFKKARRIHDVVRRFVCKILDFDGDKTEYWNLEVVKLFFASDPNFHKEIMEVVHMLVETEE